MKAHKQYKAAKAGDDKAAWVLIKDLALDFLYSIQQCVPKGCVFISPYAQEASGDNAIPLVLSLSCAEILGGESEIDALRQKKKSISACYQKTLAKELRL